MRPVTLKSFEVIYRLNMMRGDGQILRIGAILQINHDGQLAYVWFPDPALVKWLADGAPGVGFEDINFETWPELRRPNEFFDGLCLRAKTEGIDVFLRDFGVLSALYIYKDTTL